MRGRFQLPVVKPFKGVLYNKSSIKRICSVVTPPYDIISPKMQGELYKRNPYNFIRLELGKTRKTDDEHNNRYTRAGRIFNSWQDKGIFTRDDKESFYIYAQDYKDKGRAISRIGFLGLMEFDTGSESEVLPHENTLKAPKEDRLALMRQVRANLSPIFVLFDDASGNVTPLLKRFIRKEKPLFDLAWSGERHRVWRLDNPELIESISKSMHSAPLFIADGHHRFETAKNFALEGNPSSLLVYFVESDEDMLTVLPAHRLIRDTSGLDIKTMLEKLSHDFVIEKVSSLNAMMRRLGALSDKHAFGMYAGNGMHRILLLKDPKRSDRAIKNKPGAWKRLDVSILHLFIFQHILGISDTDDNVEFVKDPKETVFLVDKKRFPVAFFLNATKAGQVKEIARLGERMPRKATYFYPKPLSGLVINKLD